MKKAFFLLAITLSLGYQFAACNNSNNAKTEKLAAEETYTCTMHKEVMSDHPGKCPICGMELIKQKMTDEQKRLKESGKSVKPKD